MIHFTVTFADDASDSPLSEALYELGVPHRVIARKVLLRYRHRIWLVLVGLPRLLRFAIGFAWRSLVIERPRPDAVVVGSHIEALVFALARAVLRRHTQVYLLGFIFTRRSRPWLDRLRQSYFNWLFKHIDGVFCHSTLEVRRYEVLFAGAVGKFVFVPYGLHIDGYELPSAPVSSENAPALSAGRSGRDYQLLTRVFAANGRPLHIVCDVERTLEGCVAGANITVLRHCYDADYLAELRRASVVVVPLSVDDISAGQMVILQAMAYRKPIVATRTPTVNDYLKDGVNALLVPPGDADAMQKALDRLNTDPAFAASLGEQAHGKYIAEHSMRAFARHIVQAVVTRCPHADAAAAGELIRRS